MRKSKQSRKCSECKKIIASHNKSGLCSRCRIKKYSQTEEYKEKHRNYMKEYRKDMKVRERERKYGKEYYQKSKTKSENTLSVTTN